MLVSRKVVEFNLNQKPSGGLKFKFYPVWNFTTWFGRGEILETWSIESFSNEMRDVSDPLFPLESREETQCNTIFLILRCRRRRASLLSFFRSFFGSCLVGSLWRYGGRVVPPSAESMAERGMRRRRARVKKRWRWIGTARPTFISRESKVDMT